MLGKIKNSKYLQDENYREILTGSFFGTMYKVLGYGFTYVFLFLVARYFGAEGTGVYTLSLSILMVLAMFGQLGLNTGVLRFVGEFKAKGKNIGPLYKTVLKLVIPVSLAFSVLLFLLSDILAEKAFNDTQLALPMKIIAVTLPFLVLKNMNIEFLRGLKRIKLSEFFRSLDRQLFNVVILLGAIFFFTAIYMPVIILGISFFIGFVISLILVLNRIKFSKENLVTAKTLITVSLPMMITSFSMLLMGNIDSIMLGIFTTTENVGIYNIALKLAMIVQFILVGVNAIAAPKISEFYWGEKKEELKRIVKFSTTLMFLATFPILVMILAFPDFLLSLFGNEFIAGKDALMILAIGQFISVISGSVGIVLNMTGNQIILRNIMSVALLINIILNLILIPIFGILGASIATTISLTMWNLYSVLVVRRKLGFFTFPDLKIFL